MYIMFAPSTCSLIKEIHNYESIPRSDFINRNDNVLSMCKYIVPYVTFLYI